MTAGQAKHEEPREQVTNCPVGRRRPEFATRARGLARCARTRDSALARSLPTTLRGGEGFSADQTYSSSECCPASRRLARSVGIPTRDAGSF